MHISKIIAFLFTLSIAFCAIHFTVLKPEGINLLDFELPKISLPSFSKSKNLEELKGEYGKGSNTKTPVARKERSKIGDFAPYVIDSFNGVDVYQNGRETNVFGRNTTSDGYNLGLKYQCVEFVKRYYYEYYRHKMPNSYGHAKEFFDFSLADGGYNTDRALTQYRNPSYSKPQQGDIIVFGPTPNNSYGHIAIISQVGENHIQFVQQNGGAKNPTRINVPLGRSDDTHQYKLFGKHIEGWLRK